ncbi:MAG: peptidoglycan-binding protein [Candidatus Kaiserbacteria bacterium]|nr:peptidoglycan-binding protein [Candidatus Kaiserbacteria bacterium]
MSITNKVTVGLVSLAFVSSLVVVSSATAADDSEIAVLQSQIAKLLEQIKDLQSGQTSSSSSSSSSSASTGGATACSHTWTRNLSTGSTGDDVRQLQRFLNGNPQTQVAVSGVGSPGYETTYYGPATARAVSKFQEMYAAQILTPLGLTKGTGGFYTSTRTQLNELCQRGGVSNISVNRSGIRSATAPAVVRVTGDALAVTPGNPISDSYVVLGAQRAPFTSVVLTAGTDDVRIESVRIRRFGLSSSDNFESIALVDANGVQVGSARGLNSRDEVSLGSNFVVPSNRSVTLAIVGNMTTNTDDFSSGSIAGLEVAEVIADTRVQGGFPIRGAAHVLSNSVDLQKVVIEVGGGGGTVEFNDDTEVASVSIDLSATSVGGESADEEDAYLRSIILEQVGTADEREIGDLKVYVDDDKVDHVISADRDRFIINFGGKGVLIEEGNDVEIVVEANTDRGYKETIQFAVDDPSDLYILGASYGYGLPVCFAGDDGSGTDGVACDGKQTGDEDWQDTEGKTKTAVAEISSGKVSKGDRLKTFKDEVTYGDDVILGAYSVSFEGEDVLMEDLTFKVSLSSFPYTDTDNNAWKSAEEETMRFDSVRLRVDGENVAYANDSIDFDEPGCEKRYSTDANCDNTADDDGRVTVEFGGGFTLDVRNDREVVFEIVADLDSAWSHFEGTGVKFTLTDVDTAEGARSERDYRAEGEYFATEREFEDVKIMGNVLSFEINNDGIDGTEFVKGADNVVFGTFEVDAKDVIDDVEVRDLYVSFQIPADDGTNEKVGDLSHLNSCRILDEGGDEVADSRGVTGKKVSNGDASDILKSDQARFRFDNYVVEAGDREKLDIVCDIDDSASPGDEYRIVVDNGSAVRDRVKYRIGRDEDEKLLDGGNDSSLITVGDSGVLKISTDNPDEDETVVAVATGNSGVDDVAVLEIELEAEKEDVEILDVYLAAALGVGTITEEELEKVYDRFTLKLGSTTADADDYAADKTFANADYANLASDLATTHVIAFEDVNEFVRDGDDNTETFDLTVDFNGIDDNDGVAGQFIEGSKLYVVWEGDDSGSVNITEQAITSGNFTIARPFPTVPTVSTTETDRSLSAGSQKIYEFTVNADDEGDVYLGQVALTVALGGSPTLTDLEIHRGTSKGSSPRGKKANAIAAGTHEVAFDTPEKIDAGSSRTYSVYATIELHATNTNQSVNTKLALDPKGTPALGQVFTASVGNFVWSPNTLDEDGATAASNTDWFNGWTVLKDSDIDQWILD